MISVPRLIWLEILHRKLSFAQALAALVVAVAVSVSTVTLVRGHQLKTEAHVAQLNDEIRKITKNMGFNIDKRGESGESLRQRLWRGNDAV